MRRLLQTIVLPGRGAFSDTRRLVHLLAGFCVLLLGLCACRPKDGGIPKVLRIGYAVEAPYALVKGAMVTGEAPEIATVACASLGVSRIHWVQMSFDGLIDALLQKRIDVIAAGMFITPERGKVVAFSRPTLEVHPALLVPHANPLGLGFDTDLGKAAELRIATLSGSVEQAWLSAHGSSYLKLLNVPDANTGRAAVVSGTVDALALSAPALQVLQAGDEGDGLRVVELNDRINMPRGQVAFVFRKEDRLLREAWDDFLLSYLGSEAHRALLTQLGISLSCLPNPGERQKP